MLSQITATPTGHGLILEGNTISLVEGGTDLSVSVPDTNKTYTLSEENGVHLLKDSSGKTDQIDTGLSFDSEGQLCCVWEE